MRYLVIDKKQRIESTTDSTYAISRIKEELDKINAEYHIATTDDIEISLDKKIDISVLGEPITSFTHIIMRGHRLHKPWEYETKKIIAHYIDQYNIDNPNKFIKLQNIESYKTVPYYDKLYISKMSIENNLPIIPSLYRSSGEYTTESKIPYPYIIKDFTGENDVRIIEGKEKIKKNVYLVKDPNDLNQEFLKDKDKSKFIIQNFIPTGEDIRVYISNGKALGGYKRKAKTGFMTVLKGEYTLIDFNKEPDIQTLSEEICTAFKANFMAVDLMRDTDGKLYMLEISLNPGFKAYETKTFGGETVNIAQALINSF